MSSRNSALLIESYIFEVAEVFLVGAIPKSELKKNSDVFTACVVVTVI